MNNSFIHKPTKDEMAAVFADTMRYINSVHELQEAVIKSQEKSEFYAENSAFSLPPPAPQFKTSLSLSPMRSFEAAEKLVKLYPDSRIGVLNFASATNPGGGVTYGARAQEESLCRCSTLYPCLYRDIWWEKYYSYHRKMNDPLYTDACIFTPDVYVIKTDTNIPKRLPKESWFKVDIITCAAPNLRDEPNLLSQEMLYDLHLNRAKQILSVAAQNGIDVLVLGAFGCGAFMNDPVVVARAYNDALKGFTGYFRCVEFAIFTSSSERKNYSAFAERFT